MTTETTSIVDDLLRRTRAIAHGGTAEDLKRAYRSVLLELDVGSGIALRDGADDIGSAYMRLLSGTDRRVHGQVFTPMWAARVMASWALDGAHTLALDAGCGSGVLLLAAASVRQSRPVRLIGLDVDPLAVLMTETNGRLRGLDLDVRRADFLLDAIDEHPTAILSNPPYTRHHALSQQQKDAVERSIGHRLGLRLTRTASLHALFLARALEIAADGARIAFITPTQWLETRYGREVREYLDGIARIAAVIELSHKFFPNARTSAAITLIEKRPAKDQELNQLRVRRPLPEPDELLRALAQPKATANTSHRSQPPHRATELGTLARVHRGVATGHNRFFVLSEEERRVSRLPRSCLRSCAASPRLATGTVLTEDTLAALPDNAPRWLLVASVEPRRGPLAEYLAHGRSIGVDQRYLAKQRHPWFELRFHDTFPILFTYLNKENPRFVRNVAAAVPLNNWLVISPLEDVDPDELFVRLSDPRVLEGVARRGRHYGEGLWKLEPSELERLPLPS